MKGVLPPALANHGEERRQAIPVRDGLIQSTNPEGLSKLLPSKSDLQREGPQEHSVHVHQCIHRLVHSLPISQSTVSHMANGMEAMLEGSMPGSRQILADAQR